MYSVSAQNMLKPAEHAAHSEFPAPWKAGTILFPGHVGAARRCLPCPGWCPSGATWEARKKGTELPPKRPRHAKRVERDPSLDIFTSNDFFAFPLVSVTSVVFKPRPKRSHLRWRRTSHSQSPATERLLVLLMDAEISQCGHRARAGRGPGARAPSQKEKAANCAGTVATAAKSSQVQPSQVGGFRAHLAQYNQVRDSAAQEREVLTPGHIHNTRIEVRLQNKPAQPRAPVRGSEW